MGKVKKFNIIAHPVFEDMAIQLMNQYPDRFHHVPVRWEKFPDSGMDKIHISGLYPDNILKDSHVLFLASFHNNDVILSQFHVLIVLAESFVKDITIFLPFYPTGTMERVIVEGEVATANTIARLFSNLPAVGRTTRVIIYDLHTLQNRFYLYGNAIASMHSTVPMIVEKIHSGEANVNAIAFPDDGAYKRFKHLFEVTKLPMIICGKVRDGEIRKVTVTEGSADGLHCLIVDDLIRSGGTLYECAKAMTQQGAKSVSAFVAHACFPEKAWRRFLKDGDRRIFHKFWTTNSCPNVTKSLPTDDVYHVMDIADQLLSSMPPSIWSNLLEQEVKRKRSQMYGADD